MNEGKVTLVELVVGILIMAVILAVIGIIPIADKGVYLSGILLGTIIAILMAVSMYRSLIKSLDMDKVDAKSYMKKKVILRLFLMIVALLIALFFGEHISLIGVMLGILCLKFSAYIQPLTHKFYEKNIQQRKVRK